MINYSERRDIPPTAIQLVRESVGWIPDSQETWAEMLESALSVASAWNTDELIGIGFLVGTKTSRHTL